MTTMYNVVDRLRAGTPLSKAEREVHELAACGTLRDLHDDLDRLVAQAYDWPWPETPAAILDRLVALHNQRVEEERAGTVRWLRPDYQIARVARSAEADAEVASAEDDATVTIAAASARTAWPADAIGQITALGALIAARPLTVDEAANRFAAARREIVQRHLETLSLLGEAIVVGEGRYAATPQVT